MRGVENWFQIYCIQARPSANSSWFTALHSDSDEQKRNKTLTGTQTDVNPLDKQDWNNEREGNKSFTSWKQSTSQEIIR